MDGNGRWATARGLPVAEGHREGARALRRTVEAAVDLEIDSLAVYAFSTENWARPPDEVESIIELLDETIERELPDLAKQGVRTRFFGRRDRVPVELQEKMATLEAETAHLERLQLWIAFDYGGRAELVEAAAPPVVEGGRAPGRRVRGGHRRPSLCARAPRSRPRDPHVRGAADLELPALAVGVRGARLRRHALAGLRRGAAPSRASRSMRAARDGSARGEPVALARPRRGDLAPARHRPRLPGRLVALRARAGRRPARAARAVRHGSRPPAARPRRLPRVRADAARTAAGRARVDARRTALDVRLRIRRLRARRRQAVRDDVVRGHAARRRVGRGRDRVPPADSRHPGVRVLGGHGGALHRVRGRHGRVLRRTHVRTP